MTDTNRIEQRARELLAAECDRTVEGMHYDAYGVVTLNVALSAIRRALSARASAGEGGDAASVLRQLVSVVDTVANSGDYAIGDEAIQQLQMALEDAANGCGDGYDTAAPQPAQAGASGGGEWGDWLESQSDDDLLTIFAFRPDLAERLRAIIATPPAHGDGEGERTLKQVGWMRFKNGGAEISTAQECPPDRSAGNASHWFAIHAYEARRNG